MMAWFNVNEMVNVIMPVYMNVFLNCITTFLPHQKLFSPYPLYNPFRQVDTNPTQPLKQNSSVPPEI